MLPCIFNMSNKLRKVKYQKSFVLLALITELVSYIKKKSRHTNMNFPIWPLNGTILETLSNIPT